MRKRIALTSVPAIAAAALLGTGCGLAETAPATPTATTSAEIRHGRPSTTRWVRITGGGRIDPFIGKTTFGFTVDGNNLQGQLETVFHFVCLKAHSIAFDKFDPNPNDPGCIDFHGRVRTSDGDNHAFWAEACDKGEPGSSPGTGPDKFGICVENHRSTDETQNPFNGCDNRYPTPTPLTGGNIQVH